MANARATTDDDFHCSFCGKRRREVRKLVSGPRVFICNECVALCREIIGPRSSPPHEDAASDDSERTTLDMPAQDVGAAALPDDDDVTAERKPPDERHCSFCGKAKNDVARLVNGPTVYICNECVDLCEDIITVDAPAP